MTSAPTALATPGVAATWATWVSVTTLSRMLGALFWATVKSARPVCNTDAADRYKLVVTTLKVTMAITLMATAAAVRIVRTLRVARL